MEVKKKLQTETSAKYFRKLILATVVAVSLILLAITYLIYDEISKAPQKARMECYVNLLRENSVYDESFDSFSEYFGDYDSCEASVVVRMEEIESATVNRLSDANESFDSIRCVIKTMKNDPNYRSKVLLLEVLDFKRISWTFWKYFERSSRFHDYQNELNFQESFAINVCRKSSTKHDDVDGSGSDSIDDEDENIDSAESDIYFDSS